MQELDYEKIQLMGRYQITYQADTGLFYYHGELPDEIKAKIRSDVAAYVETAQFLARGSDAVSVHTALSWWSSLQLVPIGEGVCVPLYDKNLYESIQLDWEERAVCITDSGTDMEMRELHGPKGSGVSVFYPYDPTLTKDCRECKTVTYWMIDWVGHRVFSYEAEMSDSYEVRQIAFPLLRAMGSLENAFRWRDAAKTYEGAIPKKMMCIL